MLFEELFLEKADLQKYDMFRVLKSAGANSLTINDISDRLHLSYQQTYNTFQDLLRDMQSLDTHLDTTLDRHALLSQQTFKVSLDRYRLFLLEQSLVFQFIDYLVQSPDATVGEFCDQHFISKSTLLRKSAPLKHFMAQYSLRFAYTNLQITGDECNIRYFLFIIYWTGFHGIKWPFRNFSETETNQLVSAINSPSTDTITLLQKKLLLGLTHIRIKHGYLVRNSAAFDSLTIHNPDFEQLTLSAELFADLSNKNRQLETKFFFFAQFSLITSATETEQLQHVKTYLEAQNSDLWQFTINLFDYLAVTYHTKMTVNDEPMLTADILRALITANALQTNYPKLLDFYHTNLAGFKRTHLYQTVLTFFEQLGVKQNLATLYRNRQQIVEYLCYLLQPRFHHFEDQQIVRVWLIAENADLLTIELQRFLKHLRIVQVLPPKAKPSYADLILSTIDIQAPSIQQMAVYGIPMLHWNLEAQDSDFFRLYTKIKELYDAKMDAIKPESAP
ncbi:helix-turn-helix domain-containing protein [Loigolactobacillus zhaoyuanensis]|uniref:Helix-turn-helix domain-containing protein n=1 Tax=Loigolactobacillus zhaoyuanensis TaxID=2486017 RepID=A0ABW8UHT2_9LACO